MPICFAISFTEEKRRGSGMEAERKRWLRDTEPVTIGDMEVEPGEKQKANRHYLTF